MIVCVHCKRLMRVARNGVGADFGNGHVHLSDMWQCPRCGARVLHYDNRAIYDPEYRAADGDTYVKVAHGREAVDQDRREGEP